MRESASASVKVVRVQSLAVRGCGVFSNLSLRSDAHLTMTMAAVDWLLLNQVGHSCCLPSDLSWHKPLLLLFCLYEEVLGANSLFFQTHLCCVALAVLWVYIGASIGTCK